MFTTEDTTPVIECMQEIVELMEKQCKRDGRLNEAVLLNHVDRHPTLSREFRSEMKVFIMGVIRDSQDEVKALWKSGAIASNEDAWKLPFLVTGI